MTYIEKVWTVIAFCIFTGWAFIMSAMTYGMLSERGSETRTPHFGEIQKVKRAPPSPPQAEKF